MPIRSSGGVFDEQVLTGSLAHYVVNGANFSGAIDSHGQPVPFSAAEIIFTRISEGAYINIMNPNEDNLSFALEAGRSVWDEISLTTMIQSLGNDVGSDHIDCTVCTVKRVPYVWDVGFGPDAFIDLTDTPNTYAGAAGYAVTVNPTEDGLIFTPSGSFDDYIPVPAGTALLISRKYFITSAGAVTLPSLTGLNVAGQFVMITKPTGITVFIDVGDPSDIISTDLGPTNQIEYDATQVLVFVVSDANTWNLQIGSAL